MRQKVISAFLAVMLVASAAIAFNWESAAAKVKRSVRRVDIQVTDMFGNEQHGACTAFSINNFRDYFMTAAHCKGDAMLVDGHKSSIVYYNAAADLMILMVPESGDVPEVKPARMRECKDGTFNVPCQGQEVAAMGFGFGGLVPLLKTGNVAAVNVEMQGWGFAPKEAMLLSGFSYIPGMSGGPVFDTDGHIVGIVQWGDNENYVGGGRTMKEVMDLTAPYWGVNDNKR